MTGHEVITRGHREVTPLYLDPGVGGCHLDRVVVGREPESPGVLGRQHLLCQLICQPQSASVSLCQGPPADCVSVILICNLVTMKLLVYKHE